MVRPNPNPGQPSQRQLRVGEQVRHVLAEVLARGDIHDPELSGMLISVLEVRMSPDLRHGTVLVMPLGGKAVLGEAGEAEAVAALNRNAKELRLEVSRRLRELKYSPELRFRVDDRYDEAARIEKIFHDDRVRRDLAAGDDKKTETE
ncbi:MAG: 30S ribosome-binding factor RbfA [Beijerinckiaceae bacterium]|nr:30S ribosome-binding factor RbfA [Beijerinckiaceae bacterium]MCZ8300455.1 30S ribosome-binding factor RbfA [Beijerinckiaceae bacterium]MCZ8376752.1 30S ribosome-binding factor RbfA [Beijerinckiaceae bacterium]